VADGLLMGHLILAIAVVIFLARFQNTPIIWLSESIRTNTSSGEVTATNLPFPGPHIEYYAGRRVSYGIDYSPDVMDRLFQEEEYSMYIFCDPDISPQGVPEYLQVEPLEVCYTLIPESSVTSP
jgi:hypothetical protein